MTDSAEAIRLLIRLGEARFKLKALGYGSENFDGLKHGRARHALSEAEAAVEEAADGLWLDWLGDQSR